MREFFNLVVIALTRLPAACTKIRKLIIRASPAALRAAGRGFPKNFSFWKVSLIYFFVIVTD